MKKNFLFKKMGFVLLHTTKKNEIRSALGAILVSTHTRKKYCFNNK